MADLLLKECIAFLKKKPVFIQFPLSALLYGLEKLVEIHFTCPCNVKMNYHLVLTIFFGPFLFIFALMFLFYQPLKHEYFHCAKKANGETLDETQQSCPKSLGYCLIAPVMWVIILFLDGDYFVCGRTDWNGHYVFDEKLNRSWCKPTEGMRTETELRSLTNYNLHCSRYIGYILMSVLGSFLVTTVGLYDSCITGKCDWWPSKILMKCRRKDPEQGSQTQSGNETVNLSPENRPTEQNVIPMVGLSSDQSQKPSIPSNIPDPETKNRQGEGPTEPTGETSTEPTETELFIKKIFFP